MILLLKCQLIRNYFNIKWNKVKNIKRDKPANPVPKPRNYPYSTKTGSSRRDGSLKAKGGKNKELREDSRSQRFQMQRKKKTNQLSINLRKGSPKKAEVDLFASNSLCKEPLVEIMNVKNSK